MGSNLLTTPIRRTIKIMANTVSFKILLKEKEREDELRRMLVDQDAATRFSHLQEKLCLVFPQLKQKTFSIRWTDQDGDIITITDDEQLDIALNEMDGPVYKLLVKVKDDDKHNADSTVVHAGIVCDGCEMTPI